MYLFKEIKDKLIEQGKVRQSVVAVAAAEDTEVLEAIKTINELGIGMAILVGDADKIKACAEKTGCDLAQNRVIDIKDNAEAAAKAVAIVRHDDADILMKGLLQSKTYLRAILNKENGLRTGGLLSSITALEIPALNRMILATDCGMIVAPSLSDKIEMIRHATTLSAALGCKMPKIACVSAVETLNANMPDGYDAAVLCQMNARGQIKNCIIDGPLSMDLSISPRSVAHKGIHSPVAGKADILLMPNLQAGNVLWKSATYLAGAQSAAIVVGTTKPAVLTSRADTAEAKLNSIAMAALLATYNREAQL